MMTRFALRTIAVAIAIAGLIDPAWTSERPDDLRAVLIDLSSNGASDAISSIQSALPGVELMSRPAGRRLPCEPGDRCIVVADGSTAASVPDDSGPIHLVKVQAPSGANVALRSARTAGVHQSVSGVVRVELAREGAIAKTDLRVSDAGALVGSATHEWKQESAATIDVPWWPTATGARILHVEAVVAEGEQAAFDNAIDVGVEVTSERMPVLVFDARPSWTSTFVRRALEDDARFTVSYQARVAPSLSVGTPRAAMTSDALAAASAVIVGGPDALIAGEVAQLRQYVRERGGTLILLLERRVSAPASQLMPGTWTEHLTAQPELLGPLRAAELMRGADLPVTSSVIIRSGGQPAIASVPDGNGHVVIAGAMDAWRYRGLDANAFDRFWQSLAAESGKAGRALQLRFDDVLVQRGERVRFVVTERGLSASSKSVASAVARCGGGAAQTIRLWPSGGIHEFSGEFAATGDHCVVEISSGDRQVSGAVATADRPARGVDATLARLERESRATGGVITDAHDLSGIARALTDARATTSQVVSVYPMHSPWWIIPFAGCLSIEWWLRRRSGLR